MAENSAALAWQASCAPAHLSHVDVTITPQDTNSPVPCPHAGDRRGAAINRFIDLHNQTLSPCSAGRFQRHHRRAKPRMPSVGVISVLHYLLSRSYRKVALRRQSAPDRAWIFYPCTIFAAFSRAFAFSAGKTQVPGFIVALVQRYRAPFYLSADSISGFLASSGSTQNARYRCLPS